MLCVRHMLALRYPLLGTLAPPWNHRYILVLHDVLPGTLASAGDCSVTFILGFMTGGLQFPVNHLTVSSGPPAPGPHLHLV